MKDIQWVLILGAVCILAIISSVTSSRDTSEITVPEKLYWQDRLDKPEQKWIEQYGYNNDSILAYNILKLWQINQNYKRVIEQLDREILKLQQRVTALESKNGEPNNVE
jgi:hypothetical protein